MNKVFLATLLLLIPLSGFAGSIISPIDFEQIWLQNNQRNLFKRYHYYNEQVQLGSENLYLLGLDAASDKMIKTSDGIKDALISRLYIHYQSQKYLFLIDWFSAIPQPQDTEGFTYGDLILGKTWRYQDNRSYLTLGLRQKSTPRSVVVGSETVFNAVSDATDEKYSAFFHFNFHGYDLGTYYSEDSATEATAFYIPIRSSPNYTFTSTLYYYDDVPEANLAERYELSLDYVLNKADRTMKSGMTVSLLPDSDKIDISSVFTNYMSPISSSLSVTGGLFYYYDMENEDTLPGAKLGIVWWLESPENLRLGFSLQQNAIGDFNALVIRDELIFTFLMTSGLGI